MQQYGRWVLLAPAVLSLNRGSQVPLHAAAIARGWPGPSGISICGVVLAGDQHVVVGLATEPTRRALEGVPVVTCRVCQTRLRTPGCDPYIAQGPRPE